MIKSVQYAGILFLLPALGIAQDTFTIKGHFSKVTTPAKVTLIYMNDTTRVEDSAEVVNGNFVFTGKLSYPTDASLYMRHGAEGTRAARGIDGMSVFIENTAMTVAGVDSMKTAVLKGSVSNVEHQAFRKQLEPYLKNINEALSTAEKMTPAERAADTALMKTLRAKRDGNVHLIDSTYKAFIASHTHSYVALNAFLEHELMGKFDAVDADKRFKLFPDVLQASTTGKNIAARISKGLSVSVGNMAPAFTQNNMQGKPVQLADFRGKYVLLDFWASWCKPCRAENPYVVAAYQQFKDKGFEILSVSLDASQQDWEKAVEKDGMPWTHVSDLKYWKNAVAVQYGINSVPSNFLIDPTGKIIASNLRGEKLGEKLATLFH